MPGQAFNLPIFLRVSTPDLPNSFIEMSLECSETIRASPESVWHAITDIDNCAGHMSQIQSVKVLERPSGATMVGLKWKETRVMFGKEAEETMTVSASEEGKWYETTAVGCGTEYKARMEVADKGNGESLLTFSFKGRPLTWWSAILAKLMGFLMEGQMKTLIATDLADIKRHVETCKKT